jgi:hypothetical protein
MLSTFFHLFFKKIFFMQKHSLSFPWQAGDFCSVSGRQTVKTPDKLWKTMGVSALETSKCRYYGAIQQNAEKQRKFAGYYELPGKERFTA